LAAKIDGLYAHLAHLNELMDQTGISCAREDELYHKAVGIMRQIREAERTANHGRGRRNP
jgi:hypothetical protein